MKVLVSKNGIDVTPNKAQHKLYTQNGAVSTLVRFRFCASSNQRNQQNIHHCCGVKFGFLDIRNKCDIIKAKIEKCTKQTFT